MSHKWCQITLICRAGGNFMILWCWCFHEGFTIARIRKNNYLKTSNFFPCIIYRVYSGENKMITVRTLPTVEQKSFINLVLIYFMINLFRQTYFLQVVAVNVDPQTFDSYYNGCCNGTFWPLFHSMPDRAMFSADNWKVSLHFIWIYVFNLITRTRVV